MFSTHRGHGHALAKGMPPRELMAELFGRATGCSRGRGGSMHLFSPEIGMMGTSGIVGPCILQACGGGYAAKLMRTGAVAVAFFGDGAVNNGAFHEGLNMAGDLEAAGAVRLREQPVCHRGRRSPTRAAIPSVAARGAAFDIPSYELDGNDVLEIHRVAGEAIARARDGQGPTLIECKTYRTRAHAEGMADFSYRTREEVAEWKQRCPLVRLRDTVPEPSHNGSSAESELAARFDAIDAEVAELVREAREFAEASPPPEAATAIDARLRRAQGGAVRRHQNPAIVQ